MECICLVLVGLTAGCRTPQLCGRFVVKSLQILLGNCGKTEPATRNTKEYLCLCSQLPKQLTTVLKKRKKLREAVMIWAQSSGKTKKQNNTNPKPS